MNILTTGGITVKGCYILESTKFFMRAVFCLEDEFPEKKRK